MGWIGNEVTSGINVPWRLIFAKKEVTSEACLDFNMNPIIIDKYKHHYSDNYDHECINSLLSDVKLQAPGRQFDGRNLGGVCRS